MLLSLSFMKMLNGTGATDNSLLGAAPREDGGDSWDISVCSCGDVGFNRGNCSPFIQVGVLHTFHSQTLPCVPKSWAVACGSLAPFPDFAIGIRVVWGNQRKALGVHQVFRAFLRNPELVSPAEGKTPECTQLSAV